MNNKNTIRIDVDDIVGYTYVIKDTLKEHGCRWSPKRKLWTITKETNLDEISRVINEYNAGGKCDKCGGKCKAGYHSCYNCFQKVMEINVEL